MLQGYGVCWARRAGSAAGVLKRKARIVAGGDRVFDQYGRHYREKDLHGAPTSIEAVRLVLVGYDVSNAHAFAGWRDKRLLSVPARRTAGMDCLTSEPMAEMMVREKLQTARVACT